MGVQRRTSTHLAWGYQGISVSALKNRRKVYRKELVGQACDCGHSPEEAQGHESL